MPQQKISDTERAERVREWARQSSARRRVKLMMDGKSQLLCWIPDSLRRQLDATAAERNLSLSDTVSNLLTAALTPSIPDPEQLRDVAQFQMVDPSRQPPDVGRFQTSDPEPEPTTPTAERDAQILELHRQGVAGREIARRLGIGKSTVQGVVKRMEKA